ncbi:MAG: type II toxin-antitoxin system VapC family toxin [Aestuariibacter sp.]|nr:type II toxin-antitoxin system VapC family toxin [Aestuariibacter sp.]
MPWMLDTDTCIYLIKRKPGYETTLACMNGMLYGDILISAITLAELRFGIAKSKQQANNRAKLESFLARFEAADFDTKAAAAYGPLRACLQAQGTPIGPLDTLIAAHALSLGAIMVTIL